MKKITLQLTAIFLFFVLNGWGQTTIDFETDGSGYTPSATEGSGFTDVFNRTNPNIGGNSTYMWSVEDINLTNPNIVLDQIDITGATSFTFSIDMIAHHYNDWDDNDELLITYSVDGGTYQNLMWVENTGEQYNDPAALDTDFDGDGECAYVLPALTTGTGTDGCVVSSNVFETFVTSSISVSGTTLDITLQFNGLTATDEGIYLDNIIITPSGGGSTPTITVSPSTLTGFTYVEGSGPSSEQTFTVEGTDLTADIDLSAPTDYEISETTGSGFTSSITLTQSGGSVATTTIYTRLKSGLSAGDYNNEDVTASSSGATSQTVTCSGSVNAAGSGCATDLIISQVVENGNEKYVEIANFTGASVSLTDYDLVIYSNGSATVSTTIDLTDASSIADQDVWVIAYSSASAWSGTPDQTSGSLSFNGNDVIALRKSSSNLDVFGTIGSSAYFYDDKDVIRNASVTSPSTTYTSSDWTFSAYSGGDPADLGQHTMSCSGSAPVDPTAFTAAAASTTQIDLSWTQNGNTDAVMVVFNTSAITAAPTDGTAYAVGATFADGSEVIYNQSGTSYSHTSLSSNTQYYYKAWSVDGSDNYSTGVIDDATTLKNEPSNHVGSFAAGTPTSTTIPLTWSDNDGTVVADGYLIMANTTNTFTAPSDGTAEADDTDMADDVGQVNVTHGTEAYTWTSLKTSTTYYFAIYPYTNSGTDIDYKTDGTVPTTSASTIAANKDLIITEVADPGDDGNGKFVEIVNTGSTTIDFSTDTWYLGRQANGGNWEDILLSGTLASGAKFVIAYGANFTNFNTAYGFDPDMSSGFISGNGNDGYFLYFGGGHASGELIDAYGVIDVDGTGEAWEYEDSKAVRKRGVTGPVTTWDETEWVITPAHVQDMTPSAWKEDVTWQGTSSTDFNEVGTNWNGTRGFVPDASYNVTIPNVTNKPVVTRLSVVNTVTVQASSSIEVDANVTITVLE